MVLEIHICNLVCLYIHKNKIHHFNKTSCTYIRSYTYYSYVSHVLHTRTYDYVHNVYIATYVCTCVMSFSEAAYPDHQINDHY